MDEKEYISGLGFVANVLSKNFEQLPVYDIEPKEMPIEEQLYPDPTRGSDTKRIVQTEPSQQGG